MSRVTIVIAVLGFVVALSVATPWPATTSAVAAGNAGTTARASNHWLLDVDDDEQRFARIEQQFAGFSGSMWEVGVRYGHTFDALADGNVALARYHWNKIGDSIRLGYLRRPGRQANADAMFLEGPWRQVVEALAGEDLQAARAAFLQARGACKACHVAEAVPFMNDQPLFRRTEVFPAPAP